MAVLDLMLFGGFRARLDSGNELARPSRKGQLLLACLALRAGEPQTREKLIGLLWSDRGDQQARASLRQELTGLRKVLGELDPSPIVVDGESVSLDAAAVAVDVRQFERLLLSDATADLERAVTLYRGPFLDGLAVRDAACEEWLRHERERLRLLMLGVLDRLLARQLKTGALAQATATAEAVLAQDPLREDMHRTLMQLHADQGRHSLALRQFQTCKDLLARELGVDPEPETIRLHNEIAARRAAPPDRPLQSIGSGDASQYYLMGRSFFLRNVWGKRALDVARRLFLQAIEADPHYARAYAGLANCDCYRLLLGLPDASLDAIVANSTRALELAPDLAEAHAAKGLTLYTEGRYEEANDSFERAVALGPESFEAHYFYARSCRVLDRHDRAARLFERAAAINQNDFRSVGFLADEYRALGRFDDSLAASRRCLERINVEVAAQPDDGHALAFGSAVLAELGERERAEDWAARALRIDAHDAIVNYNLACTYAQLGRPDPAIERLRAIFASFPINRRAFFEWMRQDSALDPLRGHPEFLALAGQLAADIETSVPERTSAASAVLAPEGRLGIAVLPFANISGDPEQEFFADGLTEDIITDLSRVSALFVVARHTVFTFKGKAVRIQDVARMLNVPYVLEGSVRKAGDRVRVTVQLVDGRTGGHLWANRYDRGLEDIFALQDELSRNVVDALKVTLLPEERALIASRATTNAEAYQYYLMGRSFFLRSGWGARALRVARQMFARAGEIDPNYARAYSGIANSDCYLMCMGDPDVSFRDILANSERALALDSALAEAHATKGLALYTAGRHGEANLALEQALRLGPDLFEAHFFAARNLRAQGRYRESIPLFERAAELQPEDFRALGLVVNAYRSLGDRDGLRSAARRCLERVEAEVALHPDNAGALAFGAIMLAELGDPARAESWVARAAGLDPLDSITSYNLASAYVGIGKFEAAMERLARVYADPPFRHRSHVEWMKKDSALEPLHSHPAYRALVARLDAEPEQDPAACAAGRRPVIAVLPFDSLGGDPGQEYFSDGLTEDLIAALSLWRSFPVIARNSTFSYKGRAVDARQVARELGARYVVEGSVRRAEGRVRVTVQLIDGQSGHHVWAGKYDREWRDIFALQDQLTQQIAAVIAPELERAEVKRTVMKRPGDLDAWDCYLRGMELLTRFTPAGNVSARTMFAQAIALDPDYADAHTGLAVSHNRDLLLQCTADREASLREAMAAARRAVALDPASAAAHSALGTVHIWQGENDLALAAARRALELNPNDALNLHALGNKSDLAGDPQGIERMLQAQRLNPLDPDRHSHLCFLARAQVNARRYGEAVASARAALQRRPDYPHAHFILAVALAHLGMADEARAALMRCEQMQSGFLAQRADWRPYADATANAHLQEGLRKAGLEALLASARLNQAP